MQQRVDIRFFAAVTAFLVVGVLLSILLNWLGGSDQHEPGFRAGGQAIVLDDGAVQVTLDTSDEEQWVGFSFALGQIVPQSSSSIADVYARRYLLKAPLGAANLRGDLLVTDTQGSVPRWQLDRSSGDQRNPVLSDWYKYNFLNNRLSSRGRTFAVRTQQGVVRVQVVSFTCETRELGCLTLQYQLAERIASNVIF